VDSRVLWFILGATAMLLLLVVLDKVTVTIT
jgi:hypothetical protein